MLLVFLILTTEILTPACKTQQAALDGALAGSFAHGGFARVNADGSLTSIAFGGDKNSRRSGKLTDWLSLTSGLHRTVRENHADDVELRFGVAVCADSVDTDARTVTPRDSRGKELPAESYDLLIGADGASSAVREAVFGPDAVRTLFSSEGSVYRVARGIDKQLLPDSVRELMVNNGAGNLVRFGSMDAPASAVLYPTPKSGDTNSDFEVNAMFIAKRELMGAPEKYAAAIADTPGLPPIIAKLAAETNRTGDPPSNFGSVRWLDKFGSDRVALVGDAAHAVTSTLGHGATLGMGSALALAEALDSTDGDLDEVVAAYSAARAPQAHWLQRIEVFNAVANAGKNYRRPLLGTLALVVRSANFLGSLVLSRVSTRFAPYVVSLGDSRVGYGVMAGSVVLNAAVGVAIVSIAGAVTVAAGLAAARLVLS